MNIKYKKLPSNKKFGLFFFSIFVLLSLIFFIKNFLIFAYSFIFLSIILIILTMLKEDYLLPFNKAWMNFGIIIGKILNPFVLGLIFFGIFTPVSIFMKLFGRDELILKFKKKQTYWINYKNNEFLLKSFKNQF